MVATYWLLLKFCPVTTIHIATVHHWILKYRKQLAKHSDLTLYFTRISGPYGPSILALAEGRLASLTSILATLVLSRGLCPILMSSFHFYSVNKFKWSLKNSSLRKSNFFENEVTDRKPLYWWGFLILCMML